MSTDQQRTAAERTERCPAWGYFAGDDETNYLRRHGVKVAGPCKLPLDHDGEHSLVAPDAGSSPQGDTP